MYLLISGSVRLQQNKDPWITLCFSVVDGWNYQIICGWNDTITDHPLELLNIFVDFHALFSFVWLAVTEALMVECACRVY
jgi:hypothetical protein